MLSRLPHIFLATVVMSAIAVAQTWTPAGQMVGPLMWEFPLSLPNGTHLIPLRWVNKRNNDSLYWLEIKSFTTTPKMYERQTPNLRSIETVGDFDGNGTTDIVGRRIFSPSSYYVFNAFTTEHNEFPFDTTILDRDLQDEVAFIGDINGDGYDDDWRSSRVVYGEREAPFSKGSYIDIHDNTNPTYPDLERTYVAAVGMLGGKPCVVQMYPQWPGFYTYELVELNLDDLRQRKPRIRTALLAKFDQPGAAYGLVVLRTPDVWWLFDPNNDDGTKGRAMKITPTSISLEPVSGYWRGGYQQYYGQGGHRGDDNFPRVMDGDRPFIKQSSQTRYIDGIGDVRHSVFILARLTDVNTATVEEIGRAVPPDSQLLDSYAGYLAIVPDIDGDSINDMMINAAFKQTIQGSEKTVVSLYLTSQRPTVSVKETAVDTTMLVVDQGETWRVIDGGRCFADPSVTAQIYDVNGAMVLLAPYNVSGSDVIIEKPRNVSRQALWLRMGACTVRLP